MTRTKRVRSGSEPKGSSKKQRKKDSPGNAQSVQSQSDDEGEMDTNVDVAALLASINAKTNNKMVAEEEAIIYSDSDDDIELLSGSDDESTRVEESQDVESDEDAEGPSHSVSVRSGSESNASGSLGGSDVEEERASDEESLASDDDASDAFESVENDDLVAAMDEDESGSQVKLNKAQLADLMANFTSATSSSQIPGVLTLIKSLMRSLLVPPSAVREQHHAKRRSLKPETSEIAAKKLQDATEKILKLQRTCKYVFGEDVSDVGAHLRTLLAAVDTLLGDDKHKLLKYFKSFWIDLTVFLKNKGGRDPISRALVESLTSKVMATLVHTPQVARSLFYRLAEVCLRCDLATSSAGKALENYFDVFATAITQPKGNKGSKHTKVSQGGVLQELISSNVKQLVTAFGRLTSSKRVSPATLNGFRLLSLMIVDIMKSLRAKGLQSQVYEAGAYLMRSMEEEMSREANTEKRKKVIKKKGNYQPDYLLYSWRLLFDGLILVLLMYEAPVTLGDTEDKDVPLNSKYAFKNFAMRLFRVLTVVCRRRCQQHVALPYILKCLSLITLMSRTLKSYMPVGILMLKIGFEVFKGDNITKKKSSIVSVAKPVDINMILFIQKDEQSSLKIREDLMDVYCALITQYVSLISRHPAFAEQAVVWTRNLRQLVKSAEGQSIKGKLKQLIDAIEKTVVEVQNERAKLTLSNLPASLFIFPDAVHSKFALTPFAKKCPFVEFWQLAKV
eukprot:Blabericola_migrator_1__11920@NODE_728_length_6712_cov_159_960873_g524_i0_p1_GENE_NODE_728_length_6712_cov_159_960873_g524_i0NODE_728_length_6712_cov_159_960873_g524_i0_p1_ORF_typecomplete_len734_score157_41Noc2/PF03715_13/1_1e24SDA1/PF05285_12/0_031Sec23_helical/PF04815_15/3_1e02Sec23_helical/PF04815_15/2_3e02Sec23_helical/PF04815_15/42_NODE_728_length_6712_cov_159_960873_g524_i043096510